MSKQKHTSLQYKMMQNPNKVFKDLKQKQKVKISNWLYIETFRFYKEHDRVPDHSERQAILDTVFVKIKGAGIWIPYNEVEKYFLSKISRYEPRILRDIGNNVTYPTREERKAAKAERQKRPKRKRKKKKPVSDTIEPFDYMNDYFAFIAGYTSGGAPYGLTWEDVGIPSDLPYNVKVKLYMGYTLEDFDDPID